MADGTAMEAGTPAPPVAARAKRRRIPIRLYLIMMVGAVTIPMMVLASLAAWTYMDGNRRAFEDAAVDAAHVALAVMDQELLGIAETVRVLGTSPHLQSGDIQAFHTQAVVVSQALKSPIVLRGLDGNQLVNGYLPWGHPLPPRSSITRWDPMALGSAQPYVTDHYVGIVGGADSVAVVTTVLVDGAPRYFLHMSVPVTRLRNALLQLGLDERHAAAVLDRTGIVLARTRGHDEAVGKPSTIASWLPPPGGVTQGRATDRDGRDVFFVAKSSAATGLIAAAALPKEILEAQQRQALIVAGAVGGGLLALSLLAARLFGAPLDRALRRLAQAGQALGRRAPVPDSREKVLEVDEVQRQLHSAGAAIAAHEAERSLVLHELDHRVKNLLATVLALTGLTAREGGDTDTFRARLADRLHGLARTQDALIRGGGSSVTLAEVLQAELSMHDSGDGSRIVMEGPPVSLRSSEATALGMIAHELATNAVKYGALSTASGRVNLSWTVDATAEGQAEQLMLRWVESGGPPVTPPTQSGFGSRLIERGLARQLRATVATDFARDGVRFRLTMPLHRRSPRGDAGGQA